ncbi:phage tail sheath family protein [Paraburkholderia pallida]|uniref:Phage tail sheath family protein n=1 Tax=Paraburkholderia pallida TaxID=2547399 RepID=A0A4P7D3S8_9BURK|nr:phage tail sheath subtilisin-like domain-containing protein [Paraburkholderia pallida]QBR01450.1 phage tail sheath family protein [Paraburkholderia pallida]
MPATLNYPGVYVEELPSGVHAITGVPTSITAFVGRAARGPLNSPTVINSFSDFARQFGGIVAGYPLGYSVRDFFANGGGQAVIVRVWMAASSPSSSSTSTSSMSSASSASSAYGSSSSSGSAFSLPSQSDGVARMGATGPDSIGLALQASSPGTWGNAVQVHVVTNNLDATVAASLGYADSSVLFDLLVTDTGSGLSETIRNVSVVDGTRRIDQVLPIESQLVLMQQNPDGTPVLPNPLVAPPATAEPPLMPSPPNPPNTLGPWPNLSGGVDSAFITDPTIYTPVDGSKTGIYALENTDIFNLLCIPPDTSVWSSTSAFFTTVYPLALVYCKSRRAVLLVDPPSDWTTVAQAQVGPAGLNLTAGGDYGAIYFPMLVEADPLRPGQLANFAPSGAVAGVIAQTDATRGVWKAPAGTAAALVGVQGLSVPMTNADNGQLNPVGVNCLRTFQFTGNVVWGARTMRGADALTDDYKYLPVRRLALYIEESLYEGTQWVVFEPNDEPLWSQIRLNVQAFMQSLFLQQAFAGTTPKDAYLVKCDSETTTPYDQSIGVVNILVGFAPLRPAEFVVLQIQQLAGQTGSS